MDCPLVSIVVPCFRGEQFLADALESCLTQTYSNFEVIVVDDASPDGCAEIAAAFAARDPRFTLVRHTHNGGVSRAFNTGFRQARGHLLSRLAQDDVFLPTAIETMVRTLAHHPEAALVYCDLTLTDEALRPVKEWVTAPPEAALTEHNHMGLCVMWRREMWDRTGEFDPEFDAAEDFEYWLRAGKHFRFVRSDAGSQLLMRRHAEAGSIVYSAKQSIAMAKARCRHVLPPESARKVLATAYFDAAWLYRMQGDRHNAVVCAWTAARLLPWRLRYVKAALVNTVRWGLRRR